jgi:hypothetical protein
LDPVKHFKPSAVLEELLCRLSLLPTQRPWGIRFLLEIKAKENIEILREILPLNEGV